MLIKIINKSKNPLPSYAHEGDACMDLRAEIQNDFESKDGFEVSTKQIIPPGETALVHTGLYVDLDEGEIQIRSRSGLALKRGIHVLNSPGTIDQGYKNEIGVILHNTSKEPFEINQGDRIAQMIWCPVEKMEFEEVKELSDSDRGTNGFGSSGIK